MIWFLAASVFYSVLAATVLWNVRSKTAVAFAILLACGSIWSLELFFLSAIKDLDKLYPLFQYSRAGMYFIAPCLILFYARVLKMVINRYIALVMGLSFALAAATSVLNIGFFPTTLEYHQNRYIPVFDAFTVLYVVNFLMAIVTCAAMGAYAYRRAIFTEKLRIKWLVIGISLGGMLGVLGVFVTGLVGVAGSVFCVSCFAYAVIRHRLISVQIAINNALVRLTSGTLVVSAVLAVNGSSWRLELSHQESLFILAVTLVLALEGYPRLNRLLLKLRDRYYFPVHYNYDFTRDRIAAALKTCSSMTALWRVCNDLLLQVVRVESYSLHLSEALSGVPGSGLIRMAPGDPVPTVDASAASPLGGAFLNMLTKQEETLFYDEAAPEFKAGFADLQASAAVPIRLGSTVAGFIMLGVPCKPEQYSYDDIRLLNWFGAELGQVLETLLALGRLEEELGEAEKTLSLMGRLNEYNHDIKTPFANIEALLLAGDAFSPEERQTRILEQVRKGHALVATMTGLLKEEPRRAKSAFDLNAVIRRVVESFPTKARHVLLTLDPLPPIVGHEEEMEILLSNLLSNAFAAQDKLQHQVRIATWFDNEEARVGCIVSDNGCGIAPERLATLWQARKSTHRESGGTGVGLSVIRRITEAHGGTIIATSEAGVGTEFTLSLPVDIEASGTGQATVRSIGAAS